MLVVENDMSNTVEEAYLDALPTTSAKIRALHAAGWSRSGIAGRLGIRYQHVRNVLVADEARRSGVAEASTPFDSQRAVTLRVAPNGRVVIPAGLRDALGLDDNPVLIARLEDGELRLTPPAVALRKAQALARTLVPEGVSLADELVAERRSEAW